MLEDFEKELSLKRSPSEFLNILGIGAFSIYSVFEFSSLIEYFLREIFIISGTFPETILWLPEIICLFLFLVIFINVVNYLGKNCEKSSRKALVTVISIFFSIVVIQFLYSYFVSPILHESYYSKFELYYDNIDGYYEIRAYITFIPILKYLIVATVLLTKKFI